MESPPLQRKLVAILSADVEGYSRLMGRDEESALETLSRHRRAADDLIATYGGRIANTAGDSVLAEFASVVDAVRCAIRIQQTIAEATADDPPDQRMLFRIGINVGDVMVKDGDIFGDGVNIAARLQTLADAGGICVSRGVREHIRHLGPFRFQDLGEQLVKNIARPVRAFRVLFQGAPTIRELEEGEEIVLTEDFDAGDADDIGTARSVTAAVDEAVDEARLDLAFWEGVKDSERVEDFLAYLERHPDGEFAPLARSRIAALAAKPAEPEPADIKTDAAFELAFWDTVKDSGNPAMYRAYLDKYPGGALAAGAGQAGGVGREPGPRHPSVADAGLVEMVQQIQRVLVDPVGAGPFQFVLAVAAGQHPDAQRPGPARRQQVPDAVADHDRIADRDAEPVGGGQEQVRVRLGVLDHVAGHHRLPVEIDAQRLDGRRGAGHPAAGRNGPGDPDLVEPLQQRDGPRQRPDTRPVPGIGVGMGLLQPLDQVGRDVDVGFAQQRIGEQAAAHADAPMDAPDRERNARFVQRLLPGQDVLVHAVHQGAVEVEQEGRRRCSGHGIDS